MRSCRLFRFAVLFLLAAVPGILRAAPVPAGTTSGTGLWTELAEKPVLAARGNVSADVARRGVVPAEYRTLKLDRTVLNALLATAPREFNRRAAIAAGAPAEVLPPVTEIELPVPGTAEFERFSVEDSPIMESGLAARYPEIRTYTLQGLDHPEHAGRLDVTPAGLHAMVLSSLGQTFVDPYFADGSDPTVAIAYRKADLSPAGKPFNCLVNAPPAPSREVLARAETSLARPSGATLRVYRLALSADAEYSAAVGGGSVDSSGTFISAGTVNSALSAMVTTINRVDAVYERDFAIRMVLVNNTDKLIYLDPNTDPFTNANPNGELLGENQTTCDNVIGNANYDIGHVFSTGGGGVAYRGVVCQTYDPNTGTGKAGGVTGLPNPTGDPYDIDFVAHEMGHQFGANHPFNSTTGNCGGGNRVATTAYEPGSGTTVMAYAGICSATGNVQDLAPHSDDYFHTISYDEIDTYTTTGTGKNVVLPTVATGNHPPTVGALTAYTIPIKTPFALTAAASDQDGDPLSYCWEEFDKGAAVNATTTAGLDNGASPIFRSYTPTANATRVFPSLTYILNNANVPPLRDGTGFLIGESLPQVARTAGLNFRCTVRDNRAGGGGSNYAAVKLTVTTAAGPFAITAPNTAVTLAGGSTQTVTWNVASTSASPVSCANVKITLSTDGGYTFPFVLANSVPNNGTASVTIPNAANAGTTQGRIKVEAIGNIFFDISDANLTITTTNTAPTLSNLGSLTVRRGRPTAATGTVATAVPGSSALAGVSLSGVPDGANVTPSLNGNKVVLTATATCRLTTTNTTRTYPITVIVTDTAGSTVSGAVNLIVTPNNAPTLGTTTAATYANLLVYRNNSATVSPPAVAADADGNLAASPYSVLLPTVPAPTGVGVSIDQSSGIVTATATSTATLGATPVRVTVVDTCGAAVVKTFTLTVAAPTAPAFTSGTPPSGATAGTPFSFTFAASGPPAPTFALTSGTLPPGLILNGMTGALAGTPTTPGVYNGIQVTASNGASPSAVQNFNLTVVNSFNNYAAQNNLSGANAAPTADADGDGLINLLEYALDLPPNAASVAPAGVVRDYSGTKYLSLQFTRVPLATDITYIVEASADLATWTTLATSSAGAVLTGPGVVSDTGGNAPLTVEVRDTVAQDPAVAGQRRFMRVRVTRP